MFSLASFEGRFLGAAVAAVDVAWDFEDPLAGARRLGGFRIWVLVYLLVLMGVI